jgi:hypothetical protein
LIDQLAHLDQIIPHDSLAGCNLMNMIEGVKAICPGANDANHKSEESYCEAKNYLLHDDSPSNSKFAANRTRG